MAYDIYLDVFFFVNFTMDLLLLACCGRIIGARTTAGSCMASAAFGAAAAAVFLLFQMDFPGLGGLTAVLMGRIAFGKSNFKVTAMRGAFLFFAAFSMEGTAKWLGAKAGGLLCRYGIGGKMAFFFLFAAGFASLFLFGVIRGEANSAQLIIPVKLIFKDKSTMLNGYYDTGNQLAEPIFGSPVHIAEYEAVKEVMPKSYQQAAEFYLETGTLEFDRVTKLQMYEFTFLPYRSLGNGTGQLLGIRMDSAVFYGKAGGRRENKVVIGLTADTLSKEGSYQMILNRRLEV